MNSNIRWIPYHIIHATIITINFKSICTDYIPITLPIYIKIVQFGVHALYTQRMGFFIFFYSMDELLEILYYAIQSMMLNFVLETVTIYNLYQECAISTTVINYMFAKNIW